MIRFRSLTRSVVMLAALVVAAPAMAQNLVTNPTLDHDISGWLIYSDDGTLEIAHRADTGSTLTGGSGAGALELKSYSWNGGGAGPYQDVVVTEGVEYLAEASVFLPSGDNTADGAFLAVKWTDDEGVWLGTDFLNDQGLGWDTWLRESGAFVAPSGAVTATLWALVSTPILEGETVPGIALFDDILFEEEGSSVATQVLYVPAAASAAGLKNTMWTTTGWFANQVAYSVSIAGAFLRQGQDNSTAIKSLTPIATVPPSGFLEVKDIFAAVGGAGASGGIYLEFSASAVGLPATLVHATTTTFTPNPSGDGVYGQGLPAVGPGIVHHVVIPGVFQSAERRTNLGVLNTSGSTLELAVAISGPDGRNVAAVDWTLRPYEQRQVSLQSLGVASLSGGYAQVTRNSLGGSFRAYVSVVDQSSGDAVYTAGM